jgi:ABC-type bacteriocin/lantibiotic exporter with double-glycine peptidase domain
MDYETIVFFGALIFFIFLLTGLFLTHKQVNDTNSQLHKRLSERIPSMIGYLKALIPVLLLLIAIKIFTLLTSLYNKLV